VHANFTKAVPVSLIAMAGAKVAGAAPPLVVTGGLSLLRGRLLHYWVIRRHGWGNARAVPMVLAFLAIGGFALAILWQFLIA